MKFSIASWGRVWRSTGLIAGATTVALTFSMMPVTQAASPTPGGTLRIGVTGGSSKDSLDAHSPTSDPDIARAISLNSSLATYDTNHKLVMALASSIKANKNATEWTITLRSGLKFSDGSPLTSADVIATFSRIVTQKKDGAESLQGIDFTKTVAVDNRTVDVVLKAPDSTFVDAMAYYANGIVPANYDPTNPVGAGPFKFKSFTAGQQSEFERNPFYYVAGQPYVDSLILIDFGDDTSRVNALLSGQVDAIDGLPSAQAPVINASGSYKVLESRTGGWIPFTMRVDRAPFNDVRVRQALRLLVDRGQMVRQVLGGHGTIGNDMYAPFDACYPAKLPQRKLDVAKAKALLKAAGKSNLKIELVTAPIAAGAVEAATVFAQEAKAGGVTVKIKKLDTNAFWNNYLKWDFAESFWYTRDFLPQTAAGSLPAAPYNETHWANAKFISLVGKAKQTSDQKTRCSLIQQAMTIEYNTGGNIIWGFPNQIDAYSTKVHGLVPDKSGIPLTSFGFQRAWLTK